MSRHRRRTWTQEERENAGMIGTVLAFLLLIIGWVVVDIASR